MNERHEEWIELAAGQALGVLDPADRERFDDHLASGCEDCERALVEFTDAAYALAATTEPVAPDPALKRRVLEAVDAEPVAEPALPRLRDEPDRSARRAAPVSERRTPWAWIAGLGWATAAACAAFIFFQQSTLGEMSTQIARLQDNQALLQLQLGEERQWNASMASPAARVAYFSPTADGASGMTGWALFDPSSQRAVLVLEHLSTGPDSDFELWAIRADGPQSLGVVQVDANGRALVRIPQVDITAGIAAFAISREAKGGSPNPRAPAGPVVMVGTLSG